MTKSRISRQYYYSKNLIINSRLRLINTAILRNKLMDVDTRSLIHSYTINKIRAFPSFYKITCLATGRARGILSNISMSRLTFKNYVIQGNLVGFKKSRW